MPDTSATANPTTATPATEGPRLQYLHTQELEPSPTNPRKHFAADKLTELADSIRSSGIHQPILARPLPGNRLADTQHQPGTATRRAVLPTHEIVAGERRWRAATIAGLATAIVNRLLKDAAASNTAATAATAKAAVASQAEREEQAEKHEYDYQVRQLQQSYELDWRWLLAERTWAAIQEEITDNLQPHSGMGNPFSAMLFPGAVCIASAEIMLETIRNTEAEKRMHALLGIDGIDRHGSMLDYVRTHHYPVAVTLLLLMVYGINKFFTDNQHHGDLPGQPAYNRDTCPLELVARECGISAAGAMLSTKKEIKAKLDTLTAAHKARLAAIKATATEAQTPSLPLDPAAQATGGGGVNQNETKPTPKPAKRNPPSRTLAAQQKPKTTADEAQRDIAAALASLDEAPPTEQTTEQRAAPEGIEASPRHHQALPEPEQATTTDTNSHPAPAGKPFASGTDVWLDGTVAAWVVKHKVRAGHVWYLLRTSAGATVNAPEDRVTGRQEGGAAC